MADESKTSGVMAAVAPTITLNNGATIPQVGLGTWKSAQGEVAAAVKAALASGYRHIDCAAIYGNEAEIGGALAEVIGDGDGKIPRSEVFITSKLWNSEHAKDKVKPACQKTLKDLGLEYLDLYLIHWPFTSNKSDGSADTTPFTETWAAMEQLVDDGLVKSIGISNFNKSQIDEVLAIARIKPAMLQVEVHPYLNNTKLVEYAQSKGIAVTGYSPLGSPDRPWAKADEPKLYEQEKVLAIAKRLGKGAGQVLLRYPVQRGIVTIPKSTNAGRIASNIQLFDFELTDEDVATLASFEEARGRACGFDNMSEHPFYPFNAEF